MDEYVVFKLSLNDVETYKNDIVQLLRQSFLRSFPNTSIGDDYYDKRIKDLKEYLINGNTLVYAVADCSHLIAFIWFFIKKNLDEKVIHVTHFVVHEGYRGKGIGGNLLKKVEEYALENGINQIELLVSKENKKSVEFYINRDFEIERYVMKKQLSYDGESK